MSSSTTTATASNVASIWFGELSAELQGKWEVMVSRDRQQRQMGAAIHGKEKAAMTEERAAKGAAGAGKRKEETGGCGGGAMSDTTVYLLLDRFAPS